MAKELIELRKEIDAVDAELISQLKKRFDITAKIGEYKAESGIELFCPEREEEKLDSLKVILGEYGYSEYILGIFKDIMDHSKLQQSRNIYGTKDIFLIGMPGCGKSVLGSALAKKTYRDFIDMDALFEKEYGILPAQMIENKGEDAFRDKETELLKFLAEGSGKNGRGRIISCGGGIVVKDENRKYLTSDSIVIYIKRNLDELSRKGRPLSLACGVEKLYEQRASRYENWSDLIIENDCALSEVLDRILIGIKGNKK